MCALFFQIHASHVLKVHPDSGSFHQVPWAMKCDCISLFMSLIFVNIRCLVVVTAAAVVVAVDFKGMDAIQGGFVPR